MTRDEYYREMLQILGRHEKIPTAEIIKPTVADLRMGQLSGSLVDFTDSLCRLERDEVHKVLWKASLLRSKLLIVASVHYSNLVLQDGSNENKTVEPPEWWEAAVRQYFAVAERMTPFETSDVVISNFAVSPEIHAEISSLRRRSSLRNDLGRLADRAYLKLRMLLGRTTSQEALLGDIRNKTVAIVGNARSLASKDYGATIDGYDVVLRFNRVPIVSRRSHGYKTNWVATGIPVSQQRLNELGADRLLWLSSRRRKMNAETVAVKSLYVHPLREILSLEKRAGVSRATTGIAAIDLLSKSDLSKAMLFGFDFYRSQSSSSHQTVNTAPHAFDREEDFVRKLLRSDGRFDIAE